MFTQNTKVDRENLRKTLEKISSTKQPARLWKKAGFQTELVFFLVSDFRSLIFFFCFKNWLFLFLCLMVLPVFNSIKPVNFVLLKIKKNKPTLKQKAYVFTEIQEKIIPFEFYL